MAIKVVMKKTCPDASAYFDYWIGEDDEWEYEITVPKGDKPTTADVHFEFAEEEAV